MPRQEYCHSIYKYFSRCLRGDLEGKTKSKPVSDWDGGHAPEMVPHHSPHPTLLFKFYIVLNHIGKKDNAPFYRGRS